MTDVSGNPEEERNSDFYNQNWTEEAIHRYFYRQVRKIEILFLKSVSSRDSKEVLNIFEITLSKMHEKVSIGNSIMG